MRRAGPDTRRGGIKGELALAIPPTLVVIGVIFLIEGVTKQKLLFASLAASAFLIYYDPMNRINSVRVMVVAQLLGFIFGLATAMTLGAGYVAGGAAMVATIVVLILFDIVHPPAISTAIGFAFVSTRDHALLIFLVALILIAALVLLQRTAVVTLGWIERSAIRLEHEAVDKIEHLYADHLRPGHHASPGAARTDVQPGVVERDAAGSETGT